MRAFGHIIDHTPDDYENATIDQMNETAALWSIKYPQMPYIVQYDDDHYLAPLLVWLLHFASTPICSLQILFFKLFLHHSRFNWIGLHLHQRPHQNPTPIWWGRRTNLDLKNSSGTFFVAVFFFVKYFTFALLCLCRLNLVDAIIRQVQFLFFVLILFLSFIYSLDCKINDIALYRSALCENWYNIHNDRLHFMILPISIW